MPTVMEASSEAAVKLMTDALRHLQGVKPSRENSISITNLEQAMMWSNKDRTVKGELTPNPTHV